VYTVKCGWEAALDYGGTPPPSISLTHAPSDMWLGWAANGALSGELIWNAQSTSGLTFTLELVNSQGTKFKTTKLTPTKNTPCSPPVLPPRVTESWVAGTTFQWVVQGLTPPLAANFYIRKPGKSCWCWDSYNGFKKVSPGVYRKTFTDMTAKGTYGVQAEFTDQYHPTFSNPVKVTVP
jgi:hypothetical protein